MAPLVGRLARRVTPALRAAAPAGRGSGAPRGQSRPPRALRPKRATPAGDRGRAQALPWGPARDTAGFIGPPIGGRVWGCGPPHPLAGRFSIACGASTESKHRVVFLGTPDVRPLRAPPHCSPSAHFTASAASIPPSGLWSSPRFDQVKSLPSPPSPPSPRPKIAARVLKALLDASIEPDSTFEVCPHA